MSKSGKIYDENDMERLANLIGEKFSDNIEAFVENIDTIVDSRLRPIGKKLDKLDQVLDRLNILEKSVKETNHDVISLEKAVSKVEHRVDLLYKLGLVDVNTFHDLKLRVDRLEVVA